MHCKLKKKNKKKRLAIGIAKRFFFE